MSPVRDRTTAELVILILAATVGLLLLAVVIFVGTIEVTRPDAQLEAAVSSIITTITLLTGAVVGYLAGRSLRDRARHE